LFVRLLDNDLCCLADPTDDSSNPVRVRALMSNGSTQPELQRLGLEDPARSHPFGSLKKQGFKCRKQRDVFIGIVLLHRCWYLEDRQSIGVPNGGNGSWFVPGNMHQFFDPQCGFPEPSENVDPGFTCFFSDDASRHVFHPLELLLRDRPSFQTEAEDIDEEAQDEAIGLEALVLEAVGNSSRRNVADAEREATRALSVLRNQ